ncbi:MAG: hypothetical protein K6E11_00655 [Bacilli bacterium]|nr:hypothetical protein [Bacilli bacterium]
MIKNDDILERGTPIGRGRILLEDNTLVRLYRTNNDPFVNLRMEKHNIRVTSKFDFIEKVYYFSQESGRKESYLIKDASKFQKGNKEHIKLVADTLKKLHQSGIKFKYKYNAISRLKYYRKYTNFSPWSKEGKELLKEVKEIYSRYPLVPCHNNPNDKNILFKDGEAYLYNIEEAGMNIALFDLAFFINHHDLSENDIALLYKQYGNINEKDADVMRRFLGIYSKYQDKYINDVIEG